jgi:hypothetical protein
VISAGVLTVDELRDGFAATRALHRSGDQLPPLLVTGSLDNTLLGPVTQFLVEVPRYTIESIIRFGFIRPDQQDDFAAITGALRYLGQAPSITRIA